MAKLTPADLEEIRAKYRSTRDEYKASLMICSETGCNAYNSGEVLNALVSELKQNKLDEDYQVVPTGCLGLCAQGPLMLVQPDGILFVKVKPENVPTIVEEHLKNGKPVEDLMYKPSPDEAAVPLLKNIDFYKDQELIVLRNQGQINPELIDDYIGCGGYKALAKALTEMQPEDILAEVKRSGIRGRGGGGFPAGVKWETCINAATAINVAPYIICNANEGDPGAFTDTSIIEGDPHTVIEGLIIGARAIGANTGYIYIQKEYTLALKRLKIAIDQARDYGILGENIFSTDFNFDIHIHQGGGAFVCGESSALMKAMEGKVGEPRPKYIHTVEIGYKGLPTVLNNVETLANIPMIIDKGGEWFASIGSGDVSESPWNGSSGTKVYSIVGDINNTGLIEVPMGIKLHDLVYKIGGGVPDGKECKAIQTTDPSGGCIPLAKFDLPLDFDSLTEAGSKMGSGGLIVLDASRCMVDVARYFTGFLVDESCGRCTPCRDGLVILNEILKRISAGEGEPSDLEIIQQISATMNKAALCALGKSAPTPVISSINYFREEFLAHINDKKCPAGVCKPLIRYDILEDKCNGCGECLENCPEDAISGEKEKLHTIDQEKCTKCGICVNSCEFDAVEVV
jgi:NADP-reducing hydrogenase subunit HndC